MNGRMNSAEALMGKHNGALPHTAAVAARAPKADPSSEPAISPLLVSDYALPGLRFYEAAYPASLRMPSEAHDYAFFVLNRAGAIEEDWRTGRKVTAASGLTFMLPHQDHAVRVHEEATTFEVLLGAPWLERLPWRLGQAKGPLHFGGPSARLAERLYREFRRPDDLTPLALEGLALELLAQAARDAAVMADPAGGVGSGRGMPRWLVRAKDFLHAHYKDGPSLDHVAAAAGIHPAHLTRAFRRHFGCTLGDYARRLRIDHACRLLRGSDMPLAQVASESGFSDQAHLCRAFKAATTMTPSRFRNSATEGGAVREQEVLFRDNT